MPNLELEKTLRQAIVDVTDESTYANACALIENPEIDINGVGPTSGKAALNFAVEKLFIPLVNMQPTSKELVEYRLRIIEKLLVSKADIEVLKHPNTAKLLEAVRKLETVIVINIAARISSLTRKEDFNPASFLANLTATQNLFITTLHVFNCLLDMTKLIQKLEVEHDAELSANGFDKVTHKIIILMENHQDEGSFRFVDKYKQQLLDAGYILCLELPFNSHDYATTYKDNVRNSKFLNLAFNSGFSKNLFLFDPSYDYKHIDTMKLILGAVAKNFFSYHIRMQLRDKGMFLLICKAAKKHAGKIIVTVGAKHIAVISYLQALNLPLAIASPFVDPANLDLSKDKDGRFVPKTDADAGLTLLFTRFSTQPLQLADMKDSDSESLDRFVKSCIKF